jgi:hypothetical protein
VETPFNTVIVPPNTGALAVVIVVVVTKVVVAALEVVDLEQEVNTNAGNIVAISSKLNPNTTHKFFLFTFFSLFFYNKTLFPLR